LALLAFAVHSRALSHGFLLYDDNYFIWENATVRSGLNAQSIKWALSSTWGFWFPVTRLSHLLDSQLWGPRAGGHHLTNLLAHAGATWILFLATLRLTKKLWASAAVAALFAVHPLNVQTVAWLSERKEVLCGLFFVSALWAYAFYCERPRAGRMGLVLAFFALALMSKPMAVTLPAVLLLLDHWPLGRLWRGGRVVWRTVAEKVPLFAMTLLFSALTQHAQSSINAVADAQTFPLSMRLSNAVVSYALYLRKLFVPTSLAAFYPHPYGTLPAWMVALSACLLIALLVGAWLLRRTRPQWLVGILWWLGMFVPVIGLVQIGRQAMADHYAYLPSIGIMLALCVEVANWPVRRAALVAGGLVLVAFAAVTLRQHSYWADTETLFTHAREVTERNWLAENMLATVREREGKLAEAEAHLQTALGYLSEDPTVRGLTRAQLAGVFIKEKQVDRAFEELGKALQEAPDALDVHRGLAFTHEHHGDIAKAIDEYQWVVQRSPDDVEARRSLATALAKAARWQEALPLLEEVARVRSSSARAHFELGFAYAQLQRKKEAAEHLELALQLQPNFEPARAALAKLAASAP
jgi:protein O-mannosyl-transferase